MDYRSYSEQQGSHRSSSHDDQQPGLTQHQQHLQHLPHFAHQHGLQPPSLPHQHIQHVGQPVFVAATHGRDAFNNRRHSGQDIQSFLEASGLVPVRPTAHQQQDQQRPQPHIPAESRTHQPSIQLHQDSQLHGPSSEDPQDFSTLPTSPVLEQSAQLGTAFHREFRRQLQQQQLTKSSTSQGQHQESQGLVEAIEPQTQPQGKDADNSDQYEAETPCDLSLPQPPARIVLGGDKWPCPGPLPPAPIPPRLPPGLVYCMAEVDRKKVVGVKAEKTLEKEMDLGIFQGALVDEASGCVEESSWELCLQGKVVCYIDGKYRRNENWMLHMQCAQSAEEQNVEAVQLYGHIRFMTSKVIEPGSELRVFYSKEYARQVGFKTGLQDLDYQKEKESFQCKQCQCLYKSAKRMHRHIKLAHEQEHAGDVSPIFNWEVKKKTVVETKPPAVIRRYNGAVDKDHFICVTCGKDFPSRGRLAAHETFHEFAGCTIFCDICGVGCESAPALRKHIVFQHRARRIKCETCNKVYSSESCFKRHEREAHGFGAENLTCKKCSKEFNDEDEFEEHKISHRKTTAARKFKGNSEHNEKDRASKSGEAAEGLSEDQDGKECDNADTAFPMDMLGKRISYFERPRPYKCRHCGMKFRQYNQRKYHEQEIHEGKGTFVCPQCSQRFVTRCNLEAHMKKHNPVRPFQCHLCPRAFASERALTNHQGEHTGLKPFKCTVCSRGFRTQKLMGKHRARMHREREKRFPCSFCDKMFVERSGLRIHERRHKGIRPFVCLVCGKAFSSKDSMAVHQRVHSGEMPFKCNECGRQFRNNHNLTAHLMQHAKSGQ